MNVYKLDENKVPYRVSGQKEEAKVWRYYADNPNEKTVAKSEMVIDHEEILLSTVFLVLDHAHIDLGKPVLFETMIFGGEYDQAQWRYRHYWQAKKHHEKLAELLVNDKHEQLEQELKNYMPYE